MKSYILNSIIRGVIFLVLFSGSSYGQTYDRKSAFRFIAEEKYEELRSLADVRPELLSATIQGGVTPAHYASLLNRVKALSVIKDKAPSVLATKNDEGVTPAYLSALYNHVETLEFLARHAKSTLKEKRNNGLTPLHVACYKDNYETDRKRS